MKQLMWCHFSSLLALLITLISSTCQSEAVNHSPDTALEQFPSISDNYTGWQTALVLNYCDMALVKILSYKDRVILDEEYNTIINNINLSAIHDEEVINLLQELMDTLMAFRLTENDKALLQKEYDRLASNAFYDSFIHGGDNLVGLMVAVGGTYHSYRRNISTYKRKLNEQLWQLEKSVQTQLNDFRKKLIKNSWILIKRHNISDNWRLTEQQIEYYLTVTQDQNVDRKFRRLREIQDWFTAFPEFWYTFAQTAQEAGQTEFALSLYNKIMHSQTHLFRYDYNFSQAMMYQITLLRKIKQTPTITSVNFNTIDEKILKLLDIVTEETPFDWSKNLFSALLYLELNDIEKAKKLLVKNIDEGKEVSLNTRILGEAYALAKDEKMLSQHITHMMSDNRINYQESLVLVGKVRDTTLLQETINHVLAPGVENIQFSLEPEYFSKDALRITLPEIWFKQQPESFNVILQFPDKIVELSTENVEIQPGQMSYIFSDVLDSGEFLELRDSKKMIVTLNHPVEPIKLLVRIQTEEILVDKNVIDRSVDTTKQYGMQAFKFINSYFSEEKNASQDIKPANKKVERVIVFNKQEVKVQEDCYQVTKQAIQKVKQCRFL